MKTLNGPVVVKKSGFFGSLVSGLFMTLITITVCATGLAVYVVSVADEKVDTVLGLGQGVVSSLPELGESLPPVLSEAFDDQRDPSYREALDISVKTLPREDERYSEVVIEATNTGDKTVSLMALRIVLEQENGSIAREINEYVATPLAIPDDGHWRGPILPGSKRHCRVVLYRTPADLTPIVEVVDLRTWQAKEAQVVAALPAQ